MLYQCKIKKSGQKMPLYFISKLKYCLISYSIYCFGSYSYCLFTIGMFLLLVFFETKYFNIKYKTTNYRFENILMDLGANSYNYTNPLKKYYYLQSFLQKLQHKQMITQTKALEYTTSNMPLSLADLCGDYCEYERKFHILDYTGILLQPKPKID